MERLVGRVWESATPAWIPDVVADTNFPLGHLKAAEALGLTRHQLYIRMRKYGFE